MRMQYQKTRMPAGKKRKWLSFVKKVKAVEASGRGLQRLVINDSIVTTWNEIPTLGTGVRQQGLSEINLYSVNAALAGGRDKDIILDSSSNMLKTQDLTGTTLGIDKPALLTLETSRIKVPMKYAMIDITYTNDSSNSIELDLYVLSHRSTATTPQVDPPVSLKVAQDNYNLYNADKLYFPAGAGALNQPFSFVNLNARGVSPFMCPGLSKYAGASVVNKTKVFLNAGASVTRSYNDQKHFYIHSHDGANFLRYDKDTISYLAIAKATGNISETNNILVTSFTKTYCWTQEGVNMPRATYFPSN